ncbi:MAG: TetR/AcrR family transcriptional regulator C-terminal domain-containing protein [Lachnospiraceae bacterium]|nr:TetR/AcrR family transcriptional regulator C-terminal domain-containing protein [Lachnospiraceae bacterium]
MTHEEISMNTKKALCSTLKELMKHKAFSKITVSELIRECNVNRKTFYYHFEDIYALLRWTLEQEAFDVVRSFDFTDDYKNMFLFVIDYVEKNSFFLNCIYDSIGRDEMKRFFCKDFFSIIENIIRDIEDKGNITIDDDYRSFLCTFYTEGVAGMLINLFQNPGVHKKETIIEYLTIMIQSSLPASINAFQAARTPQRSQPQH